MMSRISAMRILAAGLGVAGLFLSAPSMKAQQAQAYRAPRTKDGKPDLNGIWQAVNTAYWDIEGHGAAPSVMWQLGAAFSEPPGLGIVEDGPIPYKPDALRKKQEN